MKWPSKVFEYGPFPRQRLDYDLFGFELGRFGRISADGRAVTLPPEYIHIDQVFIVFFFIFLTLYQLTNHNFTSTFGTRALDL